MGRQEPPWYGSSGPTFRCRGRTVGNPPPTRYFTIDDAGMSHFQYVTGYRAVIDDTCYAIDLVINETRGEVYDPLS